MCTVKGKPGNNDSNDHKYACTHSLCADKTIVCMTLGLQLLEETRSFTSGLATVPPTAESHDTTTISMVEREGGDVPDDIIDSMVAAVTSSGEEEEGELIEEGKGGYVM